jgi:hypothetical protein
VTKCLLASIDDVAPRFESEVDLLAERPGQRLGPARFAMLVVPNHRDQSALAADKGFQTRLRGWAEAGVEMFLYGWKHLGDSLNSFRQKHLTAGEGEFAALDRAEATTRLQRGRAVGEDAIGRPAAGFIPSAWLYWRGAPAAVRAESFAIAKDHLQVWRPTDGQIPARGPVLTGASRSPTRIKNALAFTALFRHRLGFLPDVRLAVHPGGTTVPALFGSIDTALLALPRGRVAARYADLLATS